MSCRLSVLQVLVLGAEGLLESVPNRDPRKTAVISASPDSKFRLSKRISTSSYNPNKAADDGTTSKI